MIVTAILFLVNAFVYSVFALVPTGSLPFSLVQGIQIGYSYAMGFDRYLPITEMFTTFALMMGIYGTIFLVRSVVFIVNWIRGR